MKHLIIKICISANWLENFQWNVHDVSAVLTMSIVWSHLFSIELSYLLRWMRNWTDNCFSLSPNSMPVYNYSLIVGVLLGEGF